MPYKESVVVWICGNHGNTSDVPPLNTSDVHLNDLLNTNQILTIVDRLCYKTCKFLDGFQAHKLAWAMMALIRDKNVSYFLGTEVTQTFYGTLTTAKNKKYIIYCVIIFSN